ncbi:MAG TPA: hypothetical protein VHC63_13210 [Acidimicrobiales bacterium]|nr:hypothetical protein [Acidimicrobiales bacterium]
MAPRRWLLDQNFPKPRFDADQLDATVTYTHLVDFNNVFSNTSTPDWLLHLAAEHDGFEGVVTTDPSQLEQDEEAIALVATNLSVVTWTHRINDPVVQWGSLIAYMPEILKQIDRHGPSLITLPVPRLTAAKVDKTAGIAGRIASQRKVSVPELRGEVLPDMRAELADRQLEHLLPYLERERAPKR